jgi:polyisoprenoid-binding protein YceI
MRPWPLVALLLVACGGAPLAGAPRELPPRAAPKADAEVYALDATNLTLDVEVKALTTHTLRFAQRSGTFTYAPSDPLASTLRVEVDTTSADATVKYVADLAKSDFLVSSTYPRAGFESHVLRKDGDEMHLVGALELRGKRRPIDFPIQLVAEDCSLRVTATFRVHRRDYGVVSPNAKLDGVVAEDVTVVAEAKVTRKRPGC